MILKPIARRSDLKQGTLKEVIAGDETLVLFEFEGEVKAYQGKCPHEGASLAQGYIADGQLVCPEHQWEFSCKDGKHSRPQDCLRSFAVTEKDGLIYLKPQQEKVEKPVARTVRTMADLPSPKGKLIIGHLDQFKSEQKHIVLENWVKESGEVYKISLLGKKFIVSADPELNQKILKSRPDTFRRFSKISEIMEEMGILGVFNAEGETWERHRKITSEALNFKNVKSYFPAIAFITERLLNRWKRASQTQESIDVQHDMTRYTVDITSTIAFGHDTNTLEKGQDVIQNHLEKIFPMINSRITAPIPMWRFFPSQKDKAFKHALVEIKSAVHGFIAAAQKRLSADPSRKEHPQNFLEALLVEQEKEGNFSDKEVFGNVFTMLLAGEDTTSNSISWALFYLAQHPEIVLKIREEAERIYPENTVVPTYEAMAQLKYADAVAQETMRLKPVTPTLYMEALEDTEVNGLAVKKGVTVMLQNKVAQTDEKNFVQAQDFIPERWLATGCPVIGAHSPDMIRAFGAGPRFCPGKTLAMNEMVITLSMICKNFDFELAVKPEEVEEVFSFTLIPRNLMIRVKSLDSHVKEGLVKEAFESL